MVWNDNADEQVVHKGQNRMKKGVGAEINAQISSIFSTTKPRKQYLDEISEVLKESNKWNHVHAVTLMHRCSKNKVDVTLALPIHKIVQIMKRDNYKEFTPQEIAQCVFGMKYMSEKKKDLPQLLELVNVKIEEVGEKWFKAGEIALCLYGMQSFSSAKDPSVATLLGYTNTMLQNPTCLMNGQEYSMSLYGLRRFEESPEVLRIVETIANNMIRDSGKATFNAQAISNSFNGLQQLSSNSTEVLSLLRVLTPKLEEYTGPFPTRSIGGLLMGLRSMSADTDEVRNTLRAVTSKIIETQRTGQEFSSLDISSAFNGLRFMSDREPAVREILSALTISFIRFREASQSKGYTLSYLSHILYGLQSMDGGSVELRLLVEVISRSMLHAPSPSSKSSVGKGVPVTVEKKSSRAKTASPPASKPLTSYDVGMSLFGLQKINLKACPEVKKILAAVR